MPQALWLRNWTAQGNTDCLTSLALGVTVSQFSVTVVDQQFDVFGGFLAALPTNKAGYLYEHSNIVGFFYVNGNKEFNWSQESEPTKHLKL